MKMRKFDNVFDALYDDEQAIEIFLYHFEHLIANERDRRLFLDYITYIVQNPGQRVNWAVLLQGTEGDGKSFFARILKAILGPSNVNGISSSVVLKSNGVKEIIILGE